MRSARALFHLALADFRERSRRTSFLVTLLAAVWLGYEVNAGHVVLHLGTHRGLLNSAWVGLQMAMAVSAFVSLVGGPGSWWRPSRRAARSTSSASGSSRRPWSPS